MLARHQMNGNVKKLKLKNIHCMHRAHVIFRSFYSAKDSIKDLVPVKNYSPHKPLLTVLGSILLSVELE